MKYITNYAKITLLGVLALSASSVFAQGPSDKQEQKTFKIHIEKDENGNKEVIDKTFASKGELEAYMKENKMDAPKAEEMEIEQELTAPPTPPIPPNASAAPPVIKQKTTKRITTKIADPKSVKRILITEKEESAEAGAPAKIKLEITEENLTPEDRAMIIQQLLDLKGFEIKIVETKK